MGLSDICGNSVAVYQKRQNRYYEYVKELKLKGSFSYEILYDVAKVDVYRDEYKIFYGYEGQYEKEHYYTRFGSGKHDVCKHRYKCRYYNRKGRCKMGQNTEHKSRDKCGSG